MKPINLPTVGQVFFYDNIPYVLHEFTDTFQLCKKEYNHWDICCHYKHSTIHEALLMAFDDLSMLTLDGKPCYKREIIVKRKINFGEVFTNSYEWVIICRPQANFIKCLNTGVETCKQDKNIEQIIEEHFGDARIGIKFGGKPCYEYA